MTKKVFCTNCRRYLGPYWMDVRPKAVCLKIVHDDPVHGVVPAGVDPRTKNADLACLDYSEKPWWERLSTETQFAIFAGALVVFFVVAGWAVFQ